MSGVRHPGSLGVRRYVDRLAAALAELGLEYRAGGVPEDGLRLHFHLANSSRAVAWQAPLARRRYLLTVHDVVPRSRALMPAYRLAVYPLCVRRAGRVVVHSAFAADLLVRASGVSRRRVAVVPHPAPETVPHLERTAARTALGIAPDGPPLFVLPGVVKRAKLVREVVVAAGPLLRNGEARLLLAGPVVDHGAVAAARALGAIVVPEPDDARYAQAIAAGDVILCLRGSSVGESNGPLLDAIGAGRAVLATRSGSIPEVARGAAWYVEGPSSSDIRAALRHLLDRGLRDSLAAAAAHRATELTWRSSAEAHIALLGEVFGA